MAYNPEIDERVKAVAAKWPKTDSKKMFGGVGYLQRGHMVCGVYQDFLILRLGPAEGKEALKQPHVKAFDITGRPMKGWVMVTQAGFTDDAALKRWLEKARDFVATLPDK